MSERLYQLPHRSFHSSPPPLLDSRCPPESCPPAYPVAAAATPIRIPAFRLGHYDRYPVRDPVPSDESRHPTRPDLGADSYRRFVRNGSYDGSLFVNSNDPTTNGLPSEHGAPLQCVSYSFPPPGVAESQGHHRRHDGKNGFQRMASLEALDRIEKQKLDSYKMANISGRRHQVSEDYDAVAPKPNRIDPCSPTFVPGAAGHYRRFSHAGVLAGVRDVMQASVSPPDVLRLPPSRQDPVARTSLPDMRPPPVHRPLPYTPVPGHAEQSPSSPFYHSQAKYDPTSYRTPLQARHAPRVQYMYPPLASQSFSHPQARRRISEPCPSQPAPSPVSPSTFPSGPSRPPRKQRVFPPSIPTAPMRLGRTSETVMIEIPEEIDEYDEARNVHVPMPDGYWYGRWSGLRDRLKMCNMEEMDADLQVFAWEWLRRCCKSAKARESLDSAKKSWIRRLRDDEQRLLAEAIAKRGCAV